jgi:hypothetical protein
MNIENCSYLYLKIALSQESGEKIMHSERVNVHEQVIF